MTDSNSQHEFSKLFGDCERELLGYLLAMVPRHTDALDLLQETAAALWEKFDQYDRSRPFVAWARSFAHLQVHKYRERSRYRGWMLRPFDDHLLDALASQFERHDDVLQLRAEALVECLKKLTAIEHDLLHNRYWKEMKLSEVAISAGVSSDQLYRRLQAIRQQLQRCIDQQLADSRA